MANENNDISDIAKKCKILLLDIEGTTTSISFVKVGLTIDRPAFCCNSCLWDIYVKANIYLIFRTILIIRSLYYGCAKWSSFGFATWRTKSKWYPLTWRFNIRFLHVLWTFYALKGYKNIRPYFSLLFLLIRKKI